MQDVHEIIKGTQVKAKYIIIILHSLIDLVQLILLTSDINIILSIIYKFNSMFHTLPWIILELVLQYIQLVSLVFNLLIIKGGGIWGLTQEEPPPLPNTYWVRYSDKEREYNKIKLIISAMLQETNHKVAQQGERTHLINKKVGINSLLYYL